MHADAVSKSTYASSAISAPDWLWLELASLAMGLVFVGVGSQDELWSVNRISGLDLALASAAELMDIEISRSIAVPSLCCDGEGVGSGMGPKVGK